MESNEQSLKSQLVETVNNIRKKYRDLNRETTELNNALNIQYKPLLDPLNKIAKATNMQKNDLSFAKNKNDEEHDMDCSLECDTEFDESKFFREVPVVSLDRIKYSTLPDFLGVINTKEHDLFYGVRAKDNGYFIGNTKISFDSEVAVEVCGESFPLTIGLMNLLFLKKPKYFLNSDLDYYKQIISLTKIHLKSNGKMKKHMRNEKFCKIIEPMFLKSGTSLQTDYMEVIRNGKIDYKYWDNPNELVDRLRLLIASQSAGHTGHNNEIISIIEELREANIIEK